MRNSRKQVVENDMSDPREVIIDGVRYVPAREAQMSVREAVTRELSLLFWGNLPVEGWQEEFDEWCSDVYIRPDEIEGKVSMHEFVDRVTARLVNSPDKI